MKHTTPPECTCVSPSGHNPMGHARDCPMRKSLESGASGTHKTTAGDPAIEAARRTMQSIPGFLRDNPHELTIWAAREALEPVLRLHRRSVESGECESCGIWPCATALMVHPCTCSAPDYQDEHCPLHGRGASDE